MKERFFVNSLHTATKRNYKSRVIDVDKAEVAELAIQWGFDYWDGSRDTGYGGYKYDGRWKKVAAQLIDSYRLKSGMNVLDVGCGKGFLLNDLKELCPGLNVYGLDISEYAIMNCLKSVKENCHLGSATKLPFEDKKFDLVFSITTLHNLFNYELDMALKEIKRVCKGESYICVEGYRNEREKVNLMYWQLTCRAFLKPEEWKYTFNRNNINCDYEFIFFE